MTSSQNQHNAPLPPSENFSSARSLQQVHAKHVHASSRASASALSLRDTRGGNASDIGDDLSICKEAAYIGKSGEWDGSGDLIIVAGDELIRSSTDEDREGRDNNSTWGEKRMIREVLANNKH
jgi:hypothetical protein